MQLEEEEEEEEEEGDEVVMAEGEQTYDLEAESGSDSIGDYSSVTEVPVMRSGPKNSHNGY